MRVYSTTSTTVHNYFTRQEYLRRPVQVDADGVGTAYGSSASLALRTNDARRDAIVRTFYVTARRRQTPVIIFSESVGGIVSRHCDDSEAYPSPFDRALHGGADRGADHAKVNCAGFLARASASRNLRPSPREPAINGRSPIRACSHVTRGGMRAADR